MIYEFKCECGHIWEEQQEMTVEHTAICPKCGVKDIKSIITGGTGFAFVDKHWNPTPGFPDNDRKINNNVRNDIKKSKDGKP